MIKIILDRTEARQKNKVDEVIELFKRFKKYRCDGRSEAEKLEFFNEVINPMEALYADMNQSERGELWKRIQQDC